MKIRHVGAVAALGLAILACTPAVGRAAELSDAVSTIEPARSTAAELGKRTSGVGSEPSIRLFSSQSLARSIATEVRRLNESTRRARRSTGVLQQGGSQNRHWIQRHPVLFGTLAGFGAGFLVGYLPGDDAVFEDFTAEFNGLVLGGVGAGAGALIGWAVSR